MMNVPTVQVRAQDNANLYYNVTCVTCKWMQCIPYNEETKHLLGTTYDCPEYYKWWRKIMNCTYIKREDEQEYQWHIPFHSRKYKYVDDPNGEIPPSSEQVYFELEDHRIVEGQIIVEPSGFFTLYDNNWQGWSKILRWKFR